MNITGLNLGMAARDYIACVAMNGMLSNSELISRVSKETPHVSVVIAKLAYDISDQMMKRMSGYSSEQNN